MKRCICCLAYRRRHLYFFYKRSRYKDGFANQCRECSRKSAKDWGQAYPEKVSARTKLWRIKNYKRYLAYNKQWAKDHPETERKKRQRREALLRGASIIENIDIAVVASRDKWVCQICHKRVSQSLKFPHPLSPSLDHVIPITEGGNHTYQNVALAHLRCNGIKGNFHNFPQQQRLFG